ncbi:hypothetical protein KKF91_17070, partial [Myxococcota bacterium]|nr:hypothetical protein [Myxococcota bacterium]
GLTETHSFTQLERLISRGALTREGGALRLAPAVWAEYAARGGFERVRIADVEADLQDVVAALGGPRNQRVRFGTNPPALFAERVQLAEGVEVALEIIAPTWDLLVERAYSALNRLGLWSAS